MQQLHAPPRQGSPPARGSRPPFVLGGAHDAPQLPDAPLLASPPPALSSELHSRLHHYKVAAEKREAVIRRHEAREAALVEQAASLQQQLRAALHDSDEGRALRSLGVGHSAESLAALGEANRSLQALAAALQDKCLARDGEVARLEALLGSATASLAAEQQRRQAAAAEREELQALAADLHAELEAEKCLRSAEQRQLLQVRRAVDEAHAREAGTAESVAASARAAAESASRASATLRELDDAREQLFAAQRAAAEQRRLAAEAAYAAQFTRERLEAEVALLQDRFVEQQRAARLATLDRDASAVLAASSAAAVAAVGGGAGGGTLTPRRSIAFTGLSARSPVSAAASSSSDSDVVALRRGLDASRAEAGRLAASAREHEHDRATLQQRLQRSEANAARHAAHAAQLEAAVADCGSRLDAAARQIGAVEGAVAAADDRGAAAAAEAAQLRRELEQALAQLEAAASQRDDARRQLAEVEARLRRATDELAAERAAADTAAQRAQAALAAAKAEAELQRAEAEHLRGAARAAVRAHLRETSVLADEAAQQQLHQLRTLEDEGHVQGTSLGPLPPQQPSLSSSSLLLSSELAALRHQLEAQRHPASGANASSAAVAGLRVQDLSVSSGVSAASSARPILALRVSSPPQPPPPPQSQSLASNVESLVSALRRDLADAKRRLQVDVALAR